jgi:hypothetical protein
VKRLAASFLVVSLLAAGCAGGPGVRSRAVAKGLLIALTVAAAGGAAGAAVMGNNQEKKLRDDVQAGAVDGRAFGERDAEGKRWNRAARASVFVGGLALVGLVIASQMGLGDRYQYGPQERAASPPIYPTPPAGPAPASPRAPTPPTSGSK